MSDLKKNDTDNKTAQSAEKICIHCGDSCGAGSLQEGENYFCCPGCRAVYNLLHDSNLDNYYHLENKPGLKPDRTASDNRFSYLDKDNIKEKMLDFNDGRTARVTFTIPQIHCSSCIWLLENLYRLNEHVLSSVIDFQKRIASITFDISKLSLKELVILLSSIGYEPEVRLSDNGVEKSSSMAFRTLYGRLAVAGFAFGNVMLLSFPEYLGFQSSVAQDYGFIFSWSKIVLSLPVVLYSGADFYIPALKSIRQKHINMDVPIMIGIAILFVRSLYEILAQGGAGYLDSLCALVFLLLVGRLYQKKTYFSLSFRRDYRSYLPISVLVRSNNQESYVPLDELEEGNRIIMRNHEVIPADSILIKGIGKIDYSFVTGESVPITVKSGEKVYAGGRQLGQSLELEIIKKPSRSYLMQLWEQTDQAIGEQPGVTSLANKISAYFTPSILGLALITGLFWLIIDSSRALNTATAVLIIACPCALALASPFTLGTAQRIMGRRDLYLKDDQVVEKMAGLTSIVFDKTGTITQSGASEPVFVGGELDSKVKSMIFSVVRESTHPLSMLLTNQLEGSVVVAIKNFDEFRGRGLEAEVNGHNLRIGSEEWVGAKKNDNLDMTTVFVAVDKEILGYFKIANLFRKGLPDLINKLKSDYKLALLSGDNDSERSRIETIFGKESELIFNQLPHDKLSYIHSKINSGEMTAMIGDGLNDAGALKAATVGFSIVENSSSFSPACDGILISSGFRLLSSFLRLAKDSIGIIKISFLISFLYNLIGLTFAVKGTLSPVIAAALMPASSVTVVIFTTLATTLAAKHRGII